MIVSAIFKAIAFYFLFITIRGILRGYSESKKIREKVNEFKNSGFGQNTAHNQTYSNNSKATDVIEADYRVLD